MLYLECIHGTYNIYIGIHKYTIVSDNDNHMVKIKINIFDKLKFFKIIVLLKNEKPFIIDFKMQYQNLCVEIY